MESASPQTLIAEVIVDLNVGRSLDYLIPQDFPVLEGSWVEVPLRGKPVKGLITKIKHESDFKELKSVLRPIYDTQVLTPDLMKLARWMSEFYLSPLSQVIKMMIPGSVRKEKKIKTQLFVSRKLTLEETADLAAKIRQKNHAQADILDVLLKTRKGILLSELLERASASRSSVDSLVKKNILEVSTIEIDRSPLKDQEHFITKPKILNGSQKEALDYITNDLEQNNFKVHLLHGVTGSGKTEIYLQAITETLKRGKGAIMLVPEIALTEQTIDRFLSRFQESIAIIHHRLSDGERLDEWRKIREGRAPIVIGARSSIFAPVPNLGLILIDEEHESSFKQSDETPRYHAREVAIKRAQLLNAVVVMGSATPTLESYTQALSGKYRLSTLATRADSKTLPAVTLVDMKMAYEKAQGFTLFSDPLISGIKERLTNHEQTLLFLNRRGYHSCQICSACGEAVKCEQCDQILTFHKRDDQLSCHLCGVTIPPKRECPLCKIGAPLKFKGFGTEQVESQLKALFPEARIMRMDADTTRHKGSHQRLFRDFGRGKADILIGTQMVAKGLHFPEVTLVGVLSCDMSLNIPDFRASENTFQLLTQVAGRAGRGTRQGEVIFQTLIPENQTILLSKDQNYLEFYKMEMETRKLFEYPPCSFLVKISATSEEEKKAFHALETLRQKTLPFLPPHFEILPTQPAGHKKVKNIYKFNTLIKGPSILPIIHALKKSLFEFPKVKFSVDVNPLSTFF